VSELAESSDDELRWLNELEPAHDWSDDEEELVTSVCIIDKFCLNCNISLYVCVYLCVCVYVFL
jgi:hypothetical protein